MMGEGGEEAPLIAPGLPLTEARLKAGWSLLQAADQLHLDVGSVQALEAGDFAALGALVYARGHLRRYAELLALPTAQIDAACAQARLAAPGPELKRSPAGLWRGSGRAASPPPGSAAAAAAVLVVVALIWWAMRMPHGARPQRVGTAPESPSAMAAPAPRPATGPAPPNP